MIKSQIHLENKVPNKDRRFGAATDYYPVEIRYGRSVRRALLTPHQISEAIARHEKNPEDWPEPWWSRLKARLKAWFSPRVGE